MYQIKQSVIDDMHVTNRLDILVENNLPIGTKFSEFILLANYKMYHKQTLKNLEYVFVDENYELLTESDIWDCYNSLTEEEKEDCYPTIDDFVEEGTSKNGTLERLIFD
jgi:hypothetical protein